MGFFGKDKEARRLRSSDEVLSDKVKNNQAREDKIAGSSWNPLNWGAKLSRSTGIGDSDEKLIGTEKGSEILKQKGKDVEGTKKDYLSKKEEKYKEEGWDRSNIYNEGKEKAASKTDKGFMGFFGGKKKDYGVEDIEKSKGKKDYDVEDIGVSKGLSSDGIEKRKKEAEEKAAEEEKAAKEEKAKAAPGEKKWWQF